MCAGAVAEAERWSGLVTRGALTLQHPELREWKWFVQTSQRKVCITNVCFLLSSLRLEWYQQL